MPTTENVKRSADPVSLYTIRYVSGDDLPQIPKTSRKKKHYRRIYATFGLVGGDSKLCELVPGTIVDFTATAASILQIRLYAEHSHREDERMASQDCPLASLSASDMPVSVVLNSNQQRLDRPPILKLNLTVEHVGDADATALTSSMSLSESWATTARYIRLLVTLGSIPAEVNPIAKAVLALLKVGTEELEKRIRYNDAIVSLIDKMGEASKCVLSLEDHQFDDQRERQREACDVLILEVYRCLSFIRSLLHGKIIERLSTKNWEQSQELLKGLQSVMHDVAMKGSLDSQTAIFRTERLAWNIVGKVGQGVLNHLPYSEDAQAGSTQSCLPGTRVDLLRDIEEWAFDPDRQRGLLLYGAAGKGKSAVAHAVAKRLKEVGALAPFFAFDRTSRNRQAFQMIPTLAMQLACRDKQYRDRLCKLGIDELSTHDLKDQLDCLILELLGDHCGLVPLVFVIDALDECPDWDATDDGRSQKLAQDRRTLLESIRTCISTEGLPFNIRFFITTRPDSDVWDCLASSTTATVQMLPIDEVADTEQDIRLFVHDKLARTAVSNMVEEVVVAAQALFECAALLCRELTRVNRPRIVASRSDLVTRVMRAPGQALYTTYLAVLESHFDTSDETTMASYRRLLVWILLVQSPQRRVVFLDFARVLSPDVDMGDIFSGLSSLLTGTVDDGDQLVRPLHTSFRDFVLDVNASGSYAVDLHPASRVDLADACFQILNRELRFNICQLPTSFVLNDDIDELCGRVAKHVSPGLQYAARAAAGHLRQSTDTQPGIVQPRILDAVILFLEKKFLFWLEVCSCLRLPFGRTTSELQNLLAWTKIHQESELELLVMDFLRFDNRFREGVIMSAPQVYLSGLAFVPRGSHIHRLYGHPFGRLIQVSGHAPERDWPAGEPIVIHMQAGVNAVAYSCDGRQIASGSDNHTVEVWDAVTGQQIGEAFTGHDRRVNTVRFSPDNKRIASGSDDHTVRIWDAVTGEQIGEPFRGHEDRVCSVVYSPDGKRIVSSSGDRTIRFWDPENGQQLGRLSGGHTDVVHSIAYSPNGEIIASASHDGTVQMWHALTGEQLGEPLVEGHHDPFVTVAFSPDSKFIASGSNTVYLWHTATREQAGEPLRGHHNLISSVAFSPDGKQLASASTDGSIRLWDIVQGKQLGGPLTGHGDTTYIKSIEYSPDGQHIVSCSNDQTIQVWEIMTDQQPGATLGELTGPVHSVAFSPNGQQVVSGSDGGAIQLWDAVTGDQLHETFAGPASSIWSVTFSPDGMYIASSFSTACSIVLWDSTTGEQIGETVEGHCGRMVNGHGYAVWSVSFSPDSRRIVSGSSDCTIRLWDVESRQQLGEALKGHNDAVTSVAFSPDGKHIMSGSNDNTIRLWDAVTGKQVGEMRADVTCIAFSPDNKKIVSGSADGTIQIWDGETRERSGEALLGHGRWVASVAFSPDGRSIVSGSWDCTIRMWDAVTGHQIGETLRGNDGAIYSVAFSPDGKRIVSGSVKGTIRIWDTYAEQEARLDLRGQTLLDKSSGWLGTQDAHILWIPRHLRHLPLAFSPYHRLIVPSSTPHVVIRTHGAALGEEWTQIHDPRASHMEQKSFEDNAVHAEPAAS